MELDRGSLQCQWLTKTGIRLVNPLDPTGSRRKDFTPESICPHPKEQFRGFPTPPQDSGQPGRKIRISKTESRRSAQSNMMATALPPASKTPKPRNFNIIVGSIIWATLAKMAAAEARRSRRANKFAEVEESPRLPHSKILETQHDLPVTAWKIRPPRSSTSPFENG